MANYCRAVTKSLRGTMLLSLSGHIRGNWCKEYHSKVGDFPNLEVPQDCSPPKTIVKTSVSFRKCIFKPRPVVATSRQEIIIFAKFRWLSRKLVCSNEILKNVKHAISVSYNSIYREVTQNRITTKTLLIAWFHNWLTPFCGMINVPVP